ncbi:hypothetical protein [Micromonospora sp. NPDC049102]|uniref:hypothetical protein n=1 Tax=Micromonospora sp. NPDC049102 TaxID=3364265 RepID=UPI003720AAE3
MIKASYSREAVAGATVAGLMPGSMGDVMNYNPFQPQNGINAVGGNIGGWFS